jgi:hypothetical protein
MMEPLNAREVAIPVATLAALHRVLREEAGPVVAVQCLQATGFQVGQSVADGLLAEMRTSEAGGQDGPDVGPPSEGVSASAFWSRLDTYVGERGWGRLQHHRLHPAVGQLASADWAEGEGADDGEPTCSFSSGFLSGILSRVAGAPVAVLETDCRGRGDDRCAFVYGSEAVVRMLHDGLLEGRALDGVLDELGG